MNLNKKKKKKETVENTPTPSIHTGMERKRYLKILFEKMQKYDVLYCRKK